jgi:hypothetical protein
MLVIFYDTTNKVEHFCYVFPVHTNPHWARVVCSGPFSLCVMHKEGLCLSNEDMNRLMMMILDSRVFTYSQHIRLYKTVNLHE